MEDREGLNQRVYERANTILEMMVQDGVPPDAITSVALMSLGIQMHYDRLGDTERLAAILEQWAEGVRLGLYIGSPITERKRGK
jgi:hypothetical protein